jgi:hypothetical protein
MISNTGANQKASYARRIEDLNGNLEMCVLLEDRIGYVSHYA